MGEIKYEVRSMRSRGMTLAWCDGPAAHLSQVNWGLGGWATTLRREDMGEIKYEVRGTKYEVCGAGE